MNQLSERYLEDFAVGQTFGSGPLRIDRERALAFAAEFDPQPFHLDEAAARRSIFGGLTASGWHTAAVTMRLLVETELKPAGGLVGAGLDECRWPRPVRPGDELRVECEVRGHLMTEPGHLAFGVSPGGALRSTYRSIERDIAPEVSQKFGNTHRLHSGKAGVETTCGKRLHLGKSPGF